MKQVIAITGASSGFGELAARELAKPGHTVYAGMRETIGHKATQVEAAKKFARENKVDLRTVELDVALQESVDAAIQQIVREGGQLDVVIHNAGHMVFGPAEAFTPEYSAREPRGIASVAKAEERARSVGFEQQCSGRDSAVSGAVLRGEGRNGCSSRSLCA